MKGPKWFPQSLPKTNQQQKLKAFHPRPFQPHPDLGKLVKLVSRSLQSKGFLKCERSKVVSPKSTQNKSRTQKRNGDLHKQMQMPNRFEKQKTKGATFENLKVYQGDMVRCGETSWDIKMRHQDKLGQDVKVTCPDDIPFQTPRNISSKRSEMVKKVYGQTFEIPFQTHQKGLTWWPQGPLQEVEGIICIHILVNMCIYMYITYMSLGSRHFGYPFTNFALFH